MKLGSTTPDVTLITDNTPVPILNGVAELKWLTLEEMRNGRDSLEYLVREGIYQNMWYLLMAYVTWLSPLDLLTSTFTSNRIASTKPSLLLVSTIMTVILLHPTSVRSGQGFPTV